MGSTPLRATRRRGRRCAARPLDAERSPRAAEQAAEGTDPPGDLNATPDYKRHLARVLTRRALEQAAGVSSSGRPASLGDAAGEALREQRYLADRALATSVFLAGELGQPLLLEGEAGVGQDRGRRRRSPAPPARA